MRVAALVFCIALLLFGAMVAVIAWPIFALVNRSRAKEMLRLIDHLTVVAWFGSNWWESLSANSWRVRRWWLVKSLDVVEPGHCEGAFRREADVIDFMGRR